MTSIEHRVHLTLRLLALASGDDGAFQDVYTLTSAKLFGICFRILKDREEAEDVLQNVYIAIWNRAGRFDPSRASPITWLSTIARNRSIDRLRMLANQPMGRCLDAVDVADDKHDALGLLEADEDAQALQRCLDVLDERTRTLIVKAFYEGLTYPELAFLENIPLGTLKTRIRRGLGRMKLCFGEGVVCNRGEQRADHVASEAIETAGASSQAISATSASAVRLHLFPRGLP